MSEQTPTPEEVLQTTPDPEMIKQHMEGQARIVTAAATLGFLTQQVQNVLEMLTSRNPRLGLAIANELVLIYDEALRRSLKVDQATPPASENQAADEVKTPEAPVEQPEAKETPSA
jgi:myosin-crossreactive antigen